MNEDGHPDHDDGEGAASDAYEFVPGIEALSGAAHPVEVPVARPVWSDRDRFLLLDSPRSKAWVDVGVLLLCLFAFELASGVILSLSVGADLGAVATEPPPSDSTANDVEDSISRALLVPMVSLRAVFSIVLIGLILRARGQRARSVGVSAERWGLNSLIGIGALPVVYGLIYLAIVMLWLVKPSLIDQMTENADRITALVPKLSPIAFVGLSLVVGMYEELIFRGFLMTRLRRGLGSWTLAVLVSTAFFTALHGIDQKPVALVLVVILSLTFSLLTIWRRSIIPAIVTHMLFDFAQFLGLYLTKGDSWN